MKKLVSNKIVNVLLASLLTLFSCSNKKVIWNGQGLINSDGVFKTKNELYRIEVTNNEDIISYSIYNKNGEIVLKSNKGISNIHRWFLYWDESNSVLWVYSGDIGSSYWNLSNGNYKETEITYQNQDKLPFIIPFDIKKDILE